MRKLHAAVIVVSFLCVVSAHAQYVVYDPKLNTQTMLNQVQNLAKYVQMIQNQVQQINTLTSQLNELQHYNQIFGDPSKILNIPSVNGLIQDLQNSGVGQAIGELQNLADGVAALTYDANGLYHNIGETFKTPNGQTVPREQERYRQFAAVNETTKNYADVYADVIARRQALKLEIAATTAQLRTASTASEVQKLTGVLIGLNGALAAADKEIDQALSLNVIQDAENRNDKEKQELARIEEQRAEFTESVLKYNNTVKLSAEAPSFPEDK
jgi:hypothetical protein